MFGFNFRKAYSSAPDVSELNELMKMFRSILQEYCKKTGGINRKVWYPKKYGLTSRQLFDLPTLGFPYRWYYDSYSWDSKGLIYLKIEFAPIVVAGNKIGGRHLPNITDIDGWTTNPSPEWRQWKRQFDATPCVPLLELITNTKILRLWLACVLKVKEQELIDKSKITALLEACGMGPNGKPLFDWNFE